MDETNKMSFKLIFMTDVFSYNIKIRSTWSCLSRKRIPQLCLLNPDDDFSIPTKDHDLIKPYFCLSRAACCRNSACLGGEKGRRDIRKDGKNHKEGNKGGCWSTKKSKELERWEIIFINSCSWHFLFQTSIISSDGNDNKVKQTQCDFGGFL